MYGFIHCCLEDMVVQLFGEAAWREILNLSGVKLRGASFLMHQVYDDDMTFKLVGAASQVSGLPVETCLEEFGKHFLVYCQKNGYDQILRVLGSNLFDFLTNLDNLHDHLASTYPGMRAPSFRVTRQLEGAPVAVAGGHQQQLDDNQDPNRNRKLDDEAEQSCMYLHYYSERLGLSPIVKGLVIAVAREFFQTEIKITECKIAIASSSAASKSQTSSGNKTSHTNDDHVVLKIDRRRASAETQEAKRAAAAGVAVAVPSPVESPKEARSLTASEASKPSSHGQQQQDRDPDPDQHHPRPASPEPACKSSTRSKSSKSMLASYTNNEFLSNNELDSLIDSEIMMQTFPFHVIFDRQFRVVQVGDSLLRVTSQFWRQKTQQKQAKTSRGSSNGQAGAPICPKSSLERNNNSRHKHREKRNRDINKRTFNSGEDNNDNSNHNHKHNDNDNVAATTTATTTTTTTTAATTSAMDKDDRRQPNNSTAKSRASDSQNVDAEVCVEVEGNRKPSLRNYNYNDNERIERNENDKFDADHEPGRRCLATNDNDNDSPKPRATSPSDTQEARPEAGESNRAQLVVKFGDLFDIVRPKIEFTFEAIADHTNQVFVVRTRAEVLNQTGASKTSAARQAGSWSVAGRPSPGCPFRPKQAQVQEPSQSGPPQAPGEPPSGTGSTKGAASEAASHEHELALRLKGQMILLMDAQLCLFLCSPRVDHLQQLSLCGLSMSDLALYDRSRELMLMSHSHKEDREAVKKLDQASNDLKKMDTKLRQENMRTNEVLHNIFPAKIASLLSHGHKVESESFDLVTCLYSDIIGFTKMCGSDNVRPIDIVRLLNTLYLQFDSLTTIHNVFKVETIGDAYVVVGGLPEPAHDHADRCVRMGIDMVRVIATVRSPADGQPIQMRIGIHSGPVMAGIVGIRVPRYSLFGNTTTLANQLETHGTGGKIHISEFTKSCLINGDKFVIEPSEVGESLREKIPFETFFVTGLADPQELAEHERILAEQVSRDFALMGDDELLLVDTSKAAPEPEEPRTARPKSRHQRPDEATRGAPLEAETLAQKLLQNSSASASGSAGLRHSRKLVIDVEGGQKAAGSNGRLACEPMTGGQPTGAHVGNTLGEGSGCTDELAKLAASLSSSIVAHAIEQVALRNHQLVAHQRAHQGGQPNSWSLGGGQLISSEHLATVADFERFDRLLSELKAERAKLELQLDRMQSLVVVSSAMSRASAAAASVATRDTLNRLAATTSQSPSPIRSPTPSVPISQPARGRHHKGPRGGSPSGGHPQSLGPVPSLSSSVQRMKRMDTLKRRKHGLLSTSGEAAVGNLGTPPSWDDPSVGASACDAASLKQNAKKQSIIAEEEPQQTLAGVLEFSLGSHGDRNPKLSELELADAEQDASSSEVSPATSASASGAYRSESVSQSQSRSQSVYCAQGHQHQDHNNHHYHLRQNQHSHQQHSRPAKWDSNKSSPTGSKQPQQQQQTDAAPTGSTGTNYQGLRLALSNLIQAADQAGRKRLSLFSNQSAASSRAQRQSKAAPGSQPVGASPRRSYARCLCLKSSPSDQSVKSEAFVER